MSFVVRLLGSLARLAPIPVIAITLVLTGNFAFLSGQQEMDSGNESFAPENEQIQAQEFAQQAFGGSSDTLMQVLIEGEDVVSPAGLATVQRIQQAILETVPESQLGGRSGAGPSPILSYLAPVMGPLAEQGTDPGALDDATVDQLFQTAGEQAPPEVAQLTEGLVAGGGADASKGLMLVFLDTDGIVGDATDEAATERIIEVERDVAQTVRDLDLPLEATAFGFELLFEPDDSFQEEVGRLFGLAALVILVILFAVFTVKPKGRLTRLTAVRRGGADVALTLFTIVASIIWMQGIGVILGPDGLGVIGAFSPPTQIIPILLIGLGVDYAIHLTSRYREEVGAGEPVDAAVERSVSTVGIALVLATMTTAVGFLTNIASPIPAIRDFGILAAVGIVTAFLLMLTFVPAVRTLLDRRAERHGRIPREAFAESTQSGLSRIMARTSLLAEHAPIVVLSVTLALGVLGGYGLTQLSTEFSFTDFLPEDSPLKQTIETIQEDFGGGFGEQTSIVIRGEVATPEVHNETLAAQRDLVGTEGVVAFGEGPAGTSPATLLMQYAGGPQAMPAVAEVAQQQGLQPDGTFPADADVGAVYRAMLEAAPQQAGAVIAEVDGQLVGSQVTVTSRSQEVGGLEFAESVEEAFAPVEQAGPEVVATSNEIVGSVIVDSLSSSQVSSLIITLLAALLLLMLAFGIRERRPGLGALTLAPVVLVVLWVFGTMAATGIPFGPVTATMSALAIGIGVPFTIHVAHRFTEDLERHHSIDDALRSTMTHTGGALAGSALTTIAGFAILITSSLVPFRQLGLVTAYAIGYALLASVIVLPSMLALWARWHERRTTPTLVRSRAELEPTKVT